MVMACRPALHDTVSWHCGARQYTLILGLFSCARPCVHQSPLAASHRGLGLGTLLQLRSPSPSDSIDFFTVSCIHGVIADLAYNHKEYAFCRFSRPAGAPI